MKKKIMAACSIVLALCIALAVAGCSHEEVDEEDMSRWILRFSSEYPSDMENGYLEMSAKELVDRRFEDNMLTITLQWDEKYIDLGDGHGSFTLEPDITLYYINDAGERIENGALNDDKYYVVLHDKKYFKDGEFRNTLRVWLPGQYQYTYFIMKNNSEDTIRGESIGLAIIVNYFVGNINQ